MDIQKEELVLSFLEIDTVSLGTYLYYLINRPNSSIIFSTYEEKPKLMKKLVEELGADVNYDGGENISINFEESSKFSELLIEHKIDLNKVNIYQGTSIFIEISKKCYNGMIFLLECGANPNFLNKSGMTPLIYAALYDSTQMMEILINYGANPYFINKNGNDFIRYIVDKDQVLYMKNLLEARGNIKPAKYILVSNILM
jgi:hypothetical protein